MQINIGEEMKIDLRTPDIRTCEVGTIVISKTGHEFELLERTNGKDVWKDLTSGLVWFDMEKEKYTHNEAVEKFKDRLPTIEEFAEAEKHGFRDILPNIEDRWFWSASLYPTGTYNARGF